jgi:protein gp37
MSDKSGIEWTDATWNPVTGCTQIPGVKGRPSGCDNCYAKRLNDTRMIANPRSVRFGHPFETVLLHPERLELPLRWSPRRIFVNSLSDLFHPDVPDEFIARVFAIMICSPQHTFQVLTKRPERMKRFMDNLGRGPHALGAGKTIGMVRSLPVTIEGDKAYAIAKMSTGSRAEYRVEYAWPAPHIQLGTSIATSDDAWRSFQLGHTRAAVRFLSVEPLVGPVDAMHLENVDWVIVGGESGKGWRPMDFAWARDVRDRCRARGIPFFFKQVAASRPTDDMIPEDLRIREFPSARAATS